MDNRTRLLVLAAEDFTGLWDARFELAHEREAQEVARQVLEQLASEELIEFYVGSDHAQAPLRALDRSDIPEALGAGSHWSVPEQGADGPFIYFAATDDGQDLVRRLHWGQDG